MEDMLSAGSLSVMMSAEAVDEPVLVQVLGSLKLDGIIDQHERYRLVISDGQHVISRVIIAVKLNDTGTTAPPERFSVIHVKEYFTTLVPRDGVIRVILVLTDIQTVFSADEIKGQIGCPSALFDEDVVIECGDTLLPWAEPVFESVSTVDTASVSLSPAPVQPVAVQAALPVVETKLQPVRALVPAAVPSTSRSSAAEQLLVPNTSTVRTRSWSRRLSPVPGHGKRPKLMGNSPTTSVTPAAVQVTHSAAPTVVVKPLKGQLTHTAMSTSMVKPSTAQLAHIAMPTSMVKPSTVQVTPTFMVKPSTVQVTPAPMVKPSTAQLTPAPGISSTGTFGGLITPIANLRPTVRRWDIKARVVAKSPIKPWTRGTGCSFTVDLADESGEIKATVFTEWVDKYYGILQKDHVYYISMGNLKTANTRFNHLNHPYELTINGATSVVPCDDVVAVVEATYKFVPLSEVSGCPHGRVIDVIGVCTSAAGEESVMTRAGVTPKREVTLVDQSATSVILKLWGEHAAGTYEPSDCPIIAVRGAMVSEYWGVLSLTTLVSSVVKVNPDIAEAHQLREWYTSTIQQ